MEDGRCGGLEVLLLLLFGLGLVLALEETLGFGEAGRALWKGFRLLALLGSTVPSMMPMALLLPLLWWLPFRAGVRGGERGPLGCNDPDGL